MVLQRSVCQKEIEDCTKRGFLDLQRGRTDAGLAGLQAAYEKSRQDESGALISSCAFNLGAAMVAVGNAAQGLPLLQRVPVATFPAKAALHLNLALAHEQLLKPSEALDEFRKAFFAYDMKDAELSLRAEIAMKVANGHEQNSKWPDAAEWFLRLSELQHRLHQPSARARAMIRHADCAVKAGQADTAREALESVAQVLNHIDDAGTRGHLFTEIGSLYLYLGQFSEAVETLRSALPDLKGDILEATARQNLGAALNAQKKFEKAIVEHRVAIRLFGQAGARASQGHSFANLAAALNELGRTAEARESFTHALLAAEDSRDVRTQWQSLEALGVFAFNAGEFTRAVENFERALALASTSTERQALVRRLEQALTQHHNVERLRANPNLTAAVASNETQRTGEDETQNEETNDEDEEDEEEDEEEVSPDVIEALERIGRVASSHKSKKWKRFYGRKSTKEKMFPNPKRNRVLLVDDAVLVPVSAKDENDEEDDEEARDSLGSITSTEDSEESSSESSEEQQSGAEAEGSEDEDTEAVRDNYKKALKAPTIEKTSKRLEKLAQRFGDKKEGASEREETEPDLPVFPGTAKLEADNEGTYEMPKQASKGTTKFSKEDDDEEDPPTLPPRLEDFPRGDRERVLFERHQEMIHNEQVANASTNEKRSRMCVVM